MMVIRDNRELREAYIIMTELLKMEQVTDKNKTVIELKRDIRRYLKDGGFKGWKGTLVKDYGIDGYITLYELPDVSDPVEYFEENERIHYVPRAWDCTGQAFTEWYKIFKRHGKTMVYHRIGYDV